MSSRPFIKLHTSYRWMPTSPQSQCLNKAWGSPPHERIIKTNQPESVLASMKLRVRCKRLHPEIKISRTSITHISCSNAMAMSTSTKASASNSNANAVDLGDFVLHGSKVTSAAHGVWRRVLRPGDTVIDATCGNGHDTLELARMVCTDEGLGYVYAFDVQEDALANSAYLLDKHLDPLLRKQVKLLQLCHSQIQKIVSDKPIKLVTFNLGYLPGGDKNLITNVDTTVQALQAASNVLQSGGLISIVAYVGHPGGQEEFEAVMKFGAGLPTDAWVCSHHEWINRSLGPRLILFVKK